MQDTQTFRANILRERLKEHYYYGNYQCKKLLISIINEPVDDWFDKKSIEELLEISREISLLDLDDKVLIKRISDIDKQDKKNYLKSITKEIAIMKDNMQNTTDIINLFTDIDKNRINTDEEFKKVNNRLDKLENSIEQILNLLQKK